MWCYLNYSSCGFLSSNIEGVDMKNLLTILCVGVFLVALAGSAHAAIGWAGQIWPVHEHTVPDNNPVGVYLQIWKGGVTDSPGQGAGIGATLFYGPNGGPYSSVAMTYNTDVGANDEYTAAIPVAALNGQTEIWFYCDAYDYTDSTTYTGAQDQNGHDPPHKLNITPVLNQDVLVYFSLCMPPEGHGEYDPDPMGVCITGDHDEITNWGSGVAMAQPCSTTSPRFYQVGVTFYAESSPYVEYKYRRNDCVDWESGGNHTVFIDDSSPMYIIPWIDHWSWYEGDDCPECGVPTQPTSWGVIKNIYR
jgi:hypothetical protein